MTNIAYLKPHVDPVPEGVGSLDDVHIIEASQPTFMGQVSSTYDLLKSGAKQHPEAPALSFFLKTESYKQPVVWRHKEWISQITRAANMFRAQGIGRHDVIAFILPNLPETHLTIWGGEAAGIVFAINPLLEPAMMAELMNAARPKMLVTLAPTPGTDIWGKAVEAARLVPSLRRILTVSPIRYVPGLAARAMSLVSAWRRPRKVGAAKVSDFHDGLNRASGEALAFEAPIIDDVASYFCTGGTTGLPKIAVRTHRTEVANALELGAAFGAGTQGAGKAVFCGLPLFHVNAQIGTGLTPWSSGAHVVLGTPMGYRAPGLLQQFWDMAEHYRFIFFSGVPTVYSALLQSPPGGQDLRELRYGVCGAAPMPVELFNRFQKETGVKILEGYGLTEGGCVSSINPPLGETKVGSIGIRLPHQDMRVVILDEEGLYVRDAETDEPGAIVIKGPNLFRGYLNDAHNKGLWVHRAGRDGRLHAWLNTGDLGRQDASGYFWLTGRKKELIIRGGHNIDPKLIEEAMHEHPAVAMAAAVGRPDAHAGEVPVVYVQLRAGQQVDTQELMAHAQAHVAERAAWPKQIEVLPALPTTAIGKIFKPALSMLQLEDVVQVEARALGLALAMCKAVQHPKLGFVVHWQADGDTSELKSRLAAYTFHQEEVV